MLLEAQWIQNQKPALLVGSVGRLLWRAEVLKIPTSYPSPLPASAPAIVSEPQPTAASPKFELFL